MASVHVCALRYPALTCSVGQTCDVGFFRDGCQPGTDQVRESAGCPYARRENHALALCERRAMRRMTQLC
eukprot:66673-Rhodomonas_salina.6